MLNLALTVRAAVFSQLNRVPRVTVSSLPLVESLKTRMHWHQTRQKVLAENVANADTPGFRPRDLRPPTFSPAGAAVGGALGIERTSERHLAHASVRPGEDSRPAARFETTPSGNGVNLEEEMLKVAQNQSDYQLAASLYQKSLHLLRVAVGRGGR